MAKSAVVTFGRLNPPTIGHYSLIKKVEQVARKVGGEPMVYVSHTVDNKKNPIDYLTKVELLSKLTRGVVKEDLANKVKNIFDLLKFIDGKYDNVVVIAGSDRISEYKTNIMKYNGRDYDFENIDFVSSGERDPDGDGVSGMSASKMREFAIKNDFQSFQKGFFPGASKVDVEVFFEMIREKLK